MRDHTSLFKAARAAYSQNRWIKAFVDMHFVLSLSRASIDPAPSEEWLQSLSDAAMDYWKVGELFLGKSNEIITYCDPTTIETGPSETAERGYEFEFPTAWTIRHRHDPLFVINYENRFAIRGVPITLNQLLLATKMGRMGEPPEFSPAVFGFGDKRGNTELSNSIANRVMEFRRKIGKLINELWPNLDVNLYAVGPNDVMQEAHNFGFI